MEFSMKNFWDGSRRALARAITIVEDERDGWEDIMKEIYHHTGRAQVIGITGAPGAGKSTLSDALIKQYRKQGKKVGIVAIDPTSPFSGGAILGDRIRMNDLTLDEGVYIRSMGTRGSLGGLSRKTTDAVKLMDAFGLDVIFIETVGVGQSEVDIVKNADTTLVVLVPGLGDDIQAIKAGILEIGDVFCINKCDRDGADRLNVEIEMMLDLGEASGLLEERRRERARTEMVEMIHDRISRHVMEDIVQTGKFADYVEQVYERENDPFTVVDSIVGNIFK